MHNPFSFGDDAAAVTVAGADPDARADDDFPEGLDRIVGPAIAAREAALHARTATKLAERDTNPRGYAGTGSKPMRLLEAHADAVLDEYAVDDPFHRTRLRDELLDRKGNMHDMRLHASGYTRAFVRPAALPATGTFNFEEAY